MSLHAHEAWFDEVLPRHTRLTKAVVSIVENILNEQGIDFLTVSGRTKDKKSALEKILRKGYLNPASQMTDLSGIRIVVYLESDVGRVANVLRAAFNVDDSNSLDKDSVLSANQIGYRSVHYVCDLGRKRLEVDEYRGLGSLKFEFQVRTVLQHAWAELAHDRNYKFSGKLPRELERKLYLYAGLLEIADKGFDETAALIDSYARSLQARTEQGDLEIEISSISLDTYVHQWAKAVGFDLTESEKDNLSDLIRELNQFEVYRLSELAALIPGEYVDVARQRQYRSTIYGVVRDWMLIHDWRRFVDKVKFNWVMDEETILDHFFSKDEYAEFRSAFLWVGGENRDD